MHLFCRWRLHRKWGFLLRCSSAFLKPTFHLTLLWFSVVTVLCDFLCNVMRKVQQKQWQIFCRKFLRKSVRLENQKVTIDLLFPFNSSRWFRVNVIDYSVNALHFTSNCHRYLAPLRNSLYKIQVHSDMVLQKSE